MSLHYWVVEIGLDLGGGTGNWFHVLPDEAKKIQTTIEDGIAEFFRFTDCAGSPCFYRCSEFIGMFESTPEQRASGRDHTRVLEEERGDVPGLDR